jgi:hypothetical protein
VAEVSIYIAEDARGHGVGHRLLGALVEASEQNGIWTLQAGIFPENAISIHLHQQIGFRIVGRRERLGSMDGIWRDIVLMERRSAVVGVYQSLRAYVASLRFFFRYLANMRWASISMNVALPLASTSPSRLRISAAR